MKLKRLLLSACLGVALLAVWVLVLNRYDEEVLMLAASAVGSQSAASGDVLCVTLRGGGPYPGCTKVYTDIQAAVDASEGGETIKVAGGVYTGVQSRVAPVGYSGSALITQVVYISKTVILQGGYTVTNWSVADSEANPTTLDARGAGRVIFISGEIRPVIEQLHITRGNADGLGGGRGDDAGGGIYLMAASATISACDVFSNTAQMGGGLFLREGDVAITNSIFISNVVDRRGGGVGMDHSNAVISQTLFVGNKAGYAGGLHIYGESIAEIISSTIRENVVLCSGGGIVLESGSEATLVGNAVVSNTAPGDPGGLCYGEGGGLLNWSCDLTLVNNIFSGNSTDYFGGGMTIYRPGPAGDVRVSGNTFIGNAADLYGGGALFFDASVTSALLEMRGNVFVGNSAGEKGGGLVVGDNWVLGEGTIVGNSAGDSGGGIWVYGGNGTLVNSIIADNQVGVHGAGLYVEGSRYLALLHNTVARNIGGDGSGIYVANYPDFFSTVVLTNTILVSHTIGISVENGNTATLQTTLWGNEMDWGGIGAIIRYDDLWGDPAFVNPVGGDYHIGFASAALDRGTNAGVSTDIDGQQRPALRRYDIGADEYWPVGALKCVYLPLVYQH